MNLKKKKLKKSNLKLVVYPQRSIVSQLLIRKYQLHNIFKGNIYDFNLDLIPLENNLLTMNDHKSIKELFFSKEFNSINKVSDSIKKLQMVFGKADAYFAKGPAATMTLRICKRDERAHASQVQYNTGKWFSARAQSNSFRKQRNRRHFDIR